MTILPGGTEAAEAGNVDVWCPVPIPSEDTQSLGQPILLSAGLSSRRAGTSPSATCRCGSCVRQGGRFPSTDLPKAA